MPCEHTLPLVEIKNYPRLLIILVQSRPAYCGDSKKIYAISKVNFLAGVHDANQELKTRQRKQPSRIPRRSHGGEDKLK